MSWKAVERSRQPYYRMAEREFRAVLMSQVKKVADHVASGGAINDETIKMLISDPEVREAYNYVYKKTGGDFAEKTYRQYSSGDTLRREFELAMENYVLNNVGNRITSVTGSTRENVVKIVRDAIADTMDAGEGEQGRLIRKKITADGGKMAGWRARMISRTEVVSASNIGQQVAAEQVGQPMVKEWLSTMDGSTRDAHAAMNGTRVGLENNFIVDGEQLFTPGDPAGSAANTINCRCTQTFIII